MDIEEGMRPGRSWSLGKNNILSPLTDQVAPAPSKPRESKESHKSENGTDGKQCTPFTFKTCVYMYVYVYINVCVVWVL